MKRISTNLRSLLTLAACLTLAASLVACVVDEDEPGDDETTAMSRTSAEIDYDFSDSDGCGLTNVRYVPYSSCERQCRYKLPTTRFLMATRDCSNNPDLALDNQCFYEGANGLVSCT